MRLVIAGCVVVLAACSPRPADTATPTVPATTTSTASTPDLVRAMDAKVKAVLMPPATFELGVKSVDDEPKLDDQLGDTAGRLSSVCLGARVDSGVSTSRKRSWEAPLYLEQHVFGLVGVTGTYVLDTVRAKARSCRTYVGDDTKTLREVRADVELPRPQDVDDSYAFCHSQPDVRQDLWDCEAFLVRGDLVVKVTVRAFGEDISKSFLPDMVERARQVLVEVG